MASPSWENLDDFLATDEDGGFATPAIIHFQDGTQKTVQVIYDEPYFNAQLGEYDVDSSQPRVTGKSSDLVKVRRGDRFQIQGQNYEALTSHQPDGTGMAVVTLAVSDA